MLPGVYEPRSTAETVLRRVVEAHLARFLDETVAATDGAGVPRFVEREFGISSGVAISGGASVASGAARAPSSG